MDAAMRRARAVLAGSDDKSDDSDVSQVLAWSLVVVLIVWAVYLALHANAEVRVLSVVHAILLFPVYIIAHYAVALLGS
jgi:hypothetical protein